MLTIDLIAKVGGFTEGLTKAERDTEKFKKDLAKKAKEIEAEWNKISLAMMAGVAGLGAVVAATVRQAGEVSKLSAVANATTTEFQRMAAGASLVGVEQDKLSDQLKDFTEKVGEFQQTGGGGMKDFFESIAPKIGLTAEAFRGLSGPQALQLYYDSLEKAGLNQQQMSFYLESMASDTTALIPLLAEGGKMLREVGDAAESTGAVMDEKTIRAANEMRVGLQLLGQQTVGLKNQLVAEMIPTLSDLVGEFGKVTVDSSLAADAGEFFATVLKGLTATAYGAYAGISLLGKSIGGVFAVADAAGLQGMSIAEMMNPRESWNIWQKNLDAVKNNGAKAREMAKEVFGDLESDALKHADRINGILAAGTGQSPSSDYAKRIVAMQEAARKAMQGSQGIAGGGGGSKGKSQADKDAEAAVRFLDTLKQQVFQTQEKTAYEKLFFEIQHKGLKLSEEQLNQATGLATAIDMAAEAEETRRARLEETTALYEQQNRLAAQAALYEMEMSTYGMGNNAAAEMRERISLMQQHQQELRKMQQDQALAVAGAGTEGEADKVRALYAQRLEILREAQDQELAMHDEFIERKRQKEADWQAGATSGLQTYLESTRDVYSQMQDATINAFGAAENALVDFVKTGELDLSAMLAGIGEDIVRMLVKMGVQMVANKLLGETLQAAGIASAAAAGTATAAAWAPAAAMASLASFGANAAPASAGIASTLALSQALALVGFAEGGYTGPGGKYDEAGIVHKGEGVLSQRDMRALGGPAAFEQFRSSLHRGYAEGGVAGLPPAVARNYSLDAAPAAPIVNVIEDASKAGQVETVQNQDGSYSTNVFVRNIRSGGDEARALEATYGLTRQGR